jgi:hypothetical protein
LSERSVSAFQLIDAPELVTMKQDHAARLHDRGAGSRSETIRIRRARAVLSTTPRVRAHALVVVVRAREKTPSASPTEIERKGGEGSSLAAGAWARRASCSAVFFVNLPRSRASSDGRALFDRGV